MNLPTKCHGGRGRPDRLRRAAALCAVLALALGMGGCRLWRGETKKADPLLEGIKSAEPPAAPTPAVTPAPAPEETPPAVSPVQVEPPTPAVEPALPASPTPPLDAAAGQKPASPPSPDEEPVAVVNGEPITMREFDLGYPAYLQSLGFPADTPQLRMKYLNTLVEDQLLQQEARRRGFDNDPQYYLRASQARREAIQDTLLSRALAPRTEVSDAEIEAYYESHKKDYVQPDVIQIRNITTYTREAAEKARQRILNGEDFRTVASQVSIHPSRAEGGALPPFARGSYNPTLENVAFGLKIGEVSDVFQTDMGYHVIEKTGETPGRVIPLDQVRNEIRARLAAEKRQAALADLERSLRQSAQIHVLKNP